MLPCTVFDESNIDDRDNHHSNRVVFERKGFTSLKMTDKVVLQRGFCVKSPPATFRRWHKRFCTLTLEPVDNVEKFLKKYHKEYNSGSISQLNAVSQYLIFSYYKDEEDEFKDKALKKFIINNSTVIDYVAGVNDYTYVIKLLLGPMYNDREIFLCFDEKSEHGNWLEAFNTTMNTPRLDSFDMNLEKPVQKYEPVKDSPLQVELKRMRSVMKEQREGTTTRTLSTTSSTASTDEEYNAFNGVDSQRRSTGDCCRH